MADYGLKVSRSGFDVATADDTQLLFSSKFPLFKIKATGTVDITIPNGSFNASASIAHGVANPAGHMVFYQAGGGSGTYYPHGPQNVNVASNCNPYADSTNLVIYLWRTSSVGEVTQTCRYYIFIDEVS